MKGFIYWCLLAVGGAPVLWGQISDQPRSFSQIDEVVRNWNADQKLWVQGDVRVSPANLTTLEKWIDEHGPNWTVVLMATAQGQVFDGYRGMDAVEQALGKGLSNRTGFGQLIHPETEETNGAAFVLFLAERKFSYFGSDAYDNRQLGERFWIGQLDLGAIEAMRNGGRVADAVKNTISQIDRQLALKIKREAVARELREEQMRQLPDKLRERISTISSRVNKARSQNSDFTGQLARPDLEGWRAKLVALELSVSNEDFELASKSYGDVVRSIGRFEETFNRWVKAKDEITKVKQQIATAPEDSEAPRALGMISKAKSSILAAEENHVRGDPVYLQQLEIAMQSVIDAEREHEKFYADREAAIAKARAKKVTYYSGGGGILALFLGWLGLMNRRRRSVLEKAHQEFEKWRVNLRGKFDRLFVLMDRASVIQRNSDHYVGETATLTGEVVHEVDE
ncbi:MAG: hypothetical protein AAF226_08920, partial [Verrucomicrobiota bacterium]